MPSRKGTLDDSEDVSSDDATGDSTQADEGQSRPVYVKVEDGEYVAQVASRLNVPVTYLLELNPDDVDRESGIVLASKLRVE